MAASSKTTGFGNNFSRPVHFRFIFTHKTVSQRIVHYFKNTLYIPLYSHVRPN